MRPARIYASLLLVGLAAHGDEPLPAEMQLAALPARTAAPTDNPSTPAKIELGRLLFFDPILSPSGEVACATCHRPEHGWTDGRATPIGLGGSGLGPARRFGAATGLPLLTRNVPTILNAGFNGLVSGRPYEAVSAPMFWDNRVEALEAQALVPIRSREEMRGDACSEANAVRTAIERLRSVPEYADRFGAVFGRDICEQDLARALAAFERSLVTPQTRFDRFIRGESGALTALEQRGLQVFQDAGCVRCHGGPMFSDYKLHFIDVPDSGPDSRRELRTPSLRQLRHTAPYMHNGSMRSIRDVLVFYEALADAVSETIDGGDTTSQPPLDPLLRHLNLSADDFPAVEAFLEALSSDYDQSIPLRVPSRLSVGGGNRDASPAQ